MLKKVLVPLDGSPLAEQALGYAAEISLPTGATLVLLRAAHSHTLPGVDPRERQQGAVMEAEEYLERIATTLIGRGYACETLVPHRHPSDAIVDEARLIGAGLIIMSTHGRTGPGRMFFGSVAESVVAQASVPVLVSRAWLPSLHQPFLPDKPVFVVPLDGSTFAESAIEPAISLADDVGAALLLVRSADDRTLEPEALEYLTGVEQRVLDTHPDLHVFSEVRTGNPAQAIEDAFFQNDASLVFMATHGRGGLLRSVTGSVAGQVLTQGRAPVVLIRPEAHAETTAPVLTQLVAGASPGLQ